jgi:penicillin-insensitive murein endopeptidase
MYSIISPKLILLLGLLLFFPGFSQLSYNRPEVMHYKPAVGNSFSMIAYKIPYRGENYKFFGTVSYHIRGRAFAGKQVHNAMVEAFQLSESDCPGVHFKLLKCSGRKEGLIVPEDQKNNGFYAIFMTPLKIEERPMKHYFITGIGRVFVSYDRAGKCESSDRVNIDFESTAEHLINLDDAANMYGLRLKKVIISRYLQDELFATECGEKLKQRDIYFPKYLSKKINKKYDDLFYVEFDFQD